MDTNIITNSEMRPAISETIKELIEACGYNYDFSLEGTDHFVSSCGSKKLKFSSDHFLVFMQKFKAEEDRNAEWKMMFRCSIGYMIKDADMSMLLQVIGAIDITEMPEFKQYLNSKRPGGNAGFFGIRKNAA